MLITVLTATYNRASCLPQLYESLCQQNCKEFEWLVVDDGSSDSTEHLIKKYIAEDRIRINYVRQPNSGKHVAINNGLDHAKGRYFFIVDSDDFLPNDSIQFIVNAVIEIDGSNDFAGIVGFDRTTDGVVMSRQFSSEFIDATSLDIRYKHNLTGDLSEVFKTEIFKKYRFPQIDGEKFCPEAVVWNRIAADGLKLRYYPKVLKIIEYLPDGLTAAIVRVRAKSPVASTICYSELTKMPIPYLQRVKAAINYWRFYFCKSSNQKSSISKRWIWLLPVGLVMHVKDLRVI